MACHHVARMKLELQGAREPAHAERMTRAAQVFWTQRDGAAALRWLLAAPPGGVSAS